MTARIDADSLLAGPRGRRLCWELSRNDDERAGSVMDALSQTVSMAAYWQPPYEEDVALSKEGATADLLPVAERLLEDPATSWWGTPLDPEAQRLTQFLDEPGPPKVPVLADPRDKLASWREEQLQLNERFRAVREGRSQETEQRDGWSWSVYREPGDGPAEDYARLSGTWWSTPNRWEVPLTARTLAGHGPVALRLTEDELGWEQSHCWPATAERPVRVYEIDGPPAWAELVAGYPLDVTDSRTPDWHKVTGDRGPWLIPDWLALARDYDAVHLTVLGYLTTAGRSIRVGDGHLTLLAGWDPDATFWLRDALKVSGPVESWDLDEGLRWISVRNGPSGHGNRRASTINAPDS